MNRNLIMKQAINMLRTLAGNLLLAVAVNVFIRSFSMTAGDSTGLALIISHYLPAISFSLATTIVSWSCFFLGLLFLGMKFALTTLISTIGYPLFVQLTGFLTTSQVTADPLVAAVAGGCLMGAGLGLIIQSGASSGGLDIPPIILHRKLGWNLTVTMWLADIASLAIQSSFSPLTALLHGLILIACTYLVMNQILTIGTSAVQVLIVTAKSEEVRQLLEQDLDKGATLLHGKTAHAGRETDVILSVFERKELPALRQRVSDLDPGAFMVVSNVQEVRGLGFTGWKKIKAQDILLDE